MDNLVKEKELVLELMNFQNPNQKRLVELLEEKLDWSRVLGYLTYHRVAGLAYYTIFKKCNLSSEMNINSEFKFNLHQIYEAQKLRTKYHKDLVSELAKEINKQDLPHAFLKGSVLAVSLYPQGCRVSKDIDVLLNTSDLKKFDKIIKKLGYIQGYYNQDKSQIVPCDRKEILRWRMTTGEVVPYKKLVDRPVLNFAEIDINFSLDWLPERTSDAVAAFLKEVDYYEIEGGERFRSLSLEVFLIHLCIHLYKEAYVVNWIESQRDLTLYKFVDIYALIEDSNLKIDWNLFIKTVKKNDDGNDLIKGCYFALEYTRILFEKLNKNNDFIKVLEELKPEDTKYLNQVINPETNEKHEWTIDLKTRLFDLKRYKHLKKIES
ncbi:nucleotidyltransferase family protein [Halonatronum saccharophilum]|uniref:nucleotidyltransferase family protein n=1 Tax=Halonatronum saccharophilum TaxID=150060 RepID=UPI0004822DDF|nr:nucleotidyltransferase family protein [Halonatronum saccharophilum]